MQRLPPRDHHTSSNHYRKGANDWGPAARFRVLLSDNMYRVWENDLEHLPAGLLRPLSSDRWCVFYLINSTPSRNVYLWCLNVFIPSTSTPLVGDDEHHGHANTTPKHIELLMTAAEGWLLLTRLCLHFQNVVLFSYGELVSSHKMCLQ